MGQILEKLSFILSNSDGPVMVHSDLTQATGAIKMSTNREEVLKAHFDLLSLAAHERDIWMPTFNYDFPSKRVFNVSADASQVGLLTEYFRTDIAGWRTPIPVFSFAGTGGQPPPQTNLKCIEGFGAGSTFADLYERSGTILFYGTSVKTATFIHRVEAASGGALYRYEKTFDGVVITDWGKHALTLLLHVRPLEAPIDYDWPRIQQDLFKAGILISIELERFRAQGAEVRPLFDFWLERVRNDPLYFLNRPSRNWVEQKVQFLGRRFELQDFE